MEQAVEPGRNEKIQRLGNDLQFYFVFSSGTPAPEKFTINMVIKGMHRNNIRFFYFIPFNYVFTRPGKFPVNFIMPSVPNGKHIPRNQTFTVQEK
jgi:hypothetical protein